MRTLIAVLCAAVAGSLCVVGCGSDSSGGTATASQCVGFYSDLTQTKFSAKATPGLGCESTSDLTNSCVNDMAKIAGSCGLSCLAELSGSDPDAGATCVSKCINNNVSTPYSSSCSACYATDVACAAKYCLSRCGVAPTSDDCAQCRVEYGCAATFYACSGLPIPTGLTVPTSGEGGSGGASDAAGGASGAVSEAGSGGAVETLAGAGAN